MISCYIITSVFISANFIKAIKHRCQILGIISEERKISQFCKQENIRYFPNIEEFKNTISCKSFDVLFSIINQTILKNDLLNYPRIHTVNFHNALLPSYGGLNATSWAILNKETEHGITWHVVSEKIDEGDILIQRKFKIDDNDTAASLLVKCFKEGLNSLNDLIALYSSTTIKSYPQNLRNRSYFGAKEKPINFGFINPYKDSIADILTYERAFNLGNFDNQFISLKINLFGNILYPKDIYIQKTVHKDIQPGLIQAYTNNSISFFVKNGLVTLSNICDSANRLFNIEEIIKNTNSIMYPVDIYSQELLDKLHIGINKIATREEYWINKYKKFAQLDFQVVKNIPSIQKKHLVNSLKIPQRYLKWAQNTELAVETLLITALAIYYNKLTSNHFGHFGLKKEHIKEINDLMELNTTILPTYLPFELNLDEKATLEEILNQLSLEMKMINKNITHLNDIKIRYPSISTTNIDYCIIVNASKEKSNYNELSKSKELILDINTIDKTFSIFINNAFAEQYATNAKKLSFKILNIIQEFIEKPSQKLSAFNVFNKIECKGQTGRELKILNTKPVHQLFECVAEKYPLKNALEDNNSSLTYSELNRLANQFARFLKNHTYFSPGDVVGIFMERSMDVLVSILGVLKAGGVYLPLNIDLPEERIKFMINDANAKLIITNLFFRNKLDEIIHQQKINTNYTFINLKEKKAEFKSIKYDLNLFSYANLPYNPAQSINAYIIYTSGTTGLPKGIIISHKNLVNIAYFCRDYFFKPSCRVLQVGSISFDVTVIEWVGALVNGGCLIFTDKLNIINPIKIQKIIAQYKINTLLITPSHLQKLNLTIKNKKFRLMLAGEAVSPDLLKKYRHIEVYNGYGPTEITIIATLFKYTKAHSSTTIGKPLYNTKIYIVDSAMNKLPVGVPGEICISGIGLSAGYINNKKLTDTKFVPNPFKEKEDPIYFDKLYKTGDIGTFLKDGNINYIGRTDDQVKIRGQRVELKEIEAVLNNSKYVQNSKVLLNKNTNPNQLIAYIALNKNEFKNFSNIKEIDDNNQFFLVYESPTFNYEKIFKETLAKTLPEYMVPAYYVFVSAFPISLNGKIDHKSLLSLPINIHIHNGSLVTLSNLEEKIRDIWARILNIPQEAINLHDNFFHLGGDSLLATTLSLEIDKIFKKEVNLASFFKSPTIYNLALAINNQENSKELKYNDSKYLKDANTNLHIKFSNTKKDLVLINKNILLTGASGFLGAHILNELCKNPNVNIYCLINSTSDFNKEEKLINKEKEFNLSFNKFSKIHLIEGDIGRERLGIDFKTYEILSNKIDCIIHVASKVHHVFDYEALRAPNVLSTLELITFATHNKVKLFNYISSISVVYENINNLLSEEFPKEKEVEHFSAYVQTKWVSEKLLNQASAQGVPINIIRPPLILGSTTYGISNYKNDHFWLLIKSFIELKIAPNWNSAINALPVDYLSKSITILSQHYVKETSVYNLSLKSPVSWQDILKWLIEFGYNIELISENDWKKDYLLKLQPKSALFPLASLYIGSQFSYNIGKIKSGHADAILYKNKIKPFKFQKKYFHKCLKYLIDQKFIMIP